LKSCNRREPTTIIFFCRNLGLSLVSVGRVWFDPIRMQLATSTVVERKTPRVCAYLDQDCQGYDGQCAEKRPDGCVIRFGMGIQVFTNILGDLRHCPSLSLAFWCQIPKVGVMKFAMYVPGERCDVSCGVPLCYIRGLGSPERQMPTLEIVGVGQGKEPVTGIMICRGLCRWLDREMYTVRIRSQALYAFLFLL
jgi:hypothetical protein